MDKIIVMKTTAFTREFEIKLRKLIKTEYFFLGILALVLILGSFIRMYRLGELHPFFDDEVSFVMVGYTSLTEHKPIGWTIHYGSYEGYDSYVFDEKEYFTVEPYLDHPPLYSYLIGGWAYLTQDDVSYDYDWFVMRLPFIAISIMTIVVTFGFVYNLLGKWVAFFTAVSMAFVPSMVISARFMMAENLLALLWVTALFFLHQYIYVKSAKKTLLALALFFIVWSSFLIKLSGIVIPMSLFVISVKEKRYRLSLGIALSCFVSLATLAGYITLVDGWDVYFNVMKAHGERVQTFEHFFTLLGQINFNQIYLNDRYIGLGFLGLLFWTVKANDKKDLRIWLLGPLAAAVFVLLTVAPNQLYQWYKFITYPLMGVGLGIVWNQLRMKLLGWAFLLVSTGLLMYERILYNTAMPLDKNRLVMVVCLIPIFIFLMKPEWMKTKAYKIWFWCLLLTTLAVQLTATIQAINLG